MTWLQYISLGTVCTAYLSSLRAFRPGGEPVYRHFSFFLLFVLLGESFGIAWPRCLYHYTSFSRGNQWFYIIFHFLSTLFYLYFFHTVCTRIAVKRWIRLGALLYLLLSVLDYCFIHGPFWLNSYAEMMASCLMVLFSIVYYRQLLLNTVYIPLRQDTAFWITTGILVYNLGSVLGTLLINVMYASSGADAVPIHRIIQISAFMMYLLFATGYLCRKKH